MLTKADVEKKLFPSGTNDGCNRSDHGRKQSCIRNFSMEKVVIYYVMSRQGHCIRKEAYASCRIYRVFCMTMKRSFTIWEQGMGRSFDT